MSDLRASGAIRLARMMPRSGEGGFRRITLRIWLVLSFILLQVACAPTPGEPGSTLTPTVKSSGGSGTVRPDWPNDGSTGVPAGTQLTPWGEDCKITRPGTVIDARRVDCDLRIMTTGVEISRSLINGSVIVRQPEEGYSFTITDSQINVGERIATGLGNGNFTATRVNVTGGSRSVNCAHDCTIVDSYLHAQAGDPAGEAHLSGVRMGQNAVIRGNNIICEGSRIPPASGCSAALTGYGDFAPVQNNLIERNLFRSGTASFCAFGGSTRDKKFSSDARDIRFIGNVFERGESGHCGIHGAIEAFDEAAPGNVWEANVYEDGAVIPPRN